MTSAQPIVTSGTFAAGSVQFHRLGFGAMRIVGDGVWGPPKDHDEAIRVLRRAIELGVDLIDTADSYGPHISEELIKEALHPYGDALKIATKAGFVRTGPNQWTPLGRPEYLRQECEMSLRRLGVDRLDILQLHRIDPKVPAAEQFGLLRELRDEGKVAEVGLSEVGIADIEAANAIVPIVSVQNRYNLSDRKSEDVLDYCESNNIAFIPWAPIDAGKLAQPGGPVDEVAKELHATTSQVALAWLLRRSPVMVPIPGTSSVAHLEENCSAADVELSEAQYAAIDAAS